VEFDEVFDVVLLWLWVVVWFVLPVEPEVPWLVVPVEPEVPWLVLPVEPEVPWLPVLVLCGVASLLSDE
jgi:hypothetical protein